MKRLTLWPAFLLIAVYWIVYAGLASTELSMFMLFRSRMGALALFLLLFLIWWLTRGAIRWRERLLVLPTAVGPAVVFSRLRHRALLPRSVLFLAVLALVTAWTLWLAAARAL